MNLILQIIIGFFLADIFTGTFHWFEDTYLSYCSNIPIISEIAKDNELHHYFPRSMIAYSYLDHILYSLPPALFAIILFYLINKNFLCDYIWLIITFLLFSVCANIIHRFSHMRDCENNFIIKILQRLGLFADHEHHGVHHRESNVRYCVISQYSNTALDTLGFWRGLEALIYFITGIPPDRKLGYNDYKEIHNYMHKNAKLSCPDTPTMQDVTILKEKLDKFKKCKNN